MPQQENAFLKLQGLTGSATTTGFENQIVVQNISWGVQQTGDPTTSARIATFTDVSIVKVMDDASPSLAKHCAEKKVYGEPAIITFVDGTNQEYFKVTLKSPMVRSVSVGYSSGEAAPTETITLCYQEAEWKKGTQTASYNLSTNTGA